MRHSETKISLPDRVALRANVRALPPGHSISIEEARQGLASAAVPTRLRLLHTALAICGVYGAPFAPDEEIAAAHTAFTHNLMTDAIAGRVAAGVELGDHTIAGEGGELLLRIYRPIGQGADLPAVLFMHGGGWVGGDINQTDWWCSHMAVRAHVAVASVEYRLAPQNRFPAAIRDCHRALTWLHENHLRLAIDPGRIGVAGDSAGANLAAALCLFVRDRGGPRIVHQTLIYPALDLTLASASVREKSDAPFLSKSALEAYVGHYLGAVNSALDPHVSPLQAADVAGLPAALIQVAEHDPLRDDGWRYAAKLAAADVAVSVREYAGATHGFAMFPGLTALAWQALDDAVAFQKSQALRTSHRSSIEGEVR